MAKTDDALKGLRTLLPAEAISMDEEYSAGVVFSALAPLDKLRDAAVALKKLGFYLETMTGLEFTDTQEVVYHFNCYEPKSRLALRVLCGEGTGVPSLADLYAGASWLEREVHEFFGIHFDESPDLRRLLLPEDADYYPLKKTFGTVQAFRKRDEIYG